MIRIFVCKWRKEHSLFHVLIDIYCRHIRKNSTIAIFLKESIISTCLLRLHTEKMLCMYVLKHKKKGGVLFFFSWIVIYIYWNVSYSNEEAKYFFLLVKKLKRRFVFALNIIDHYVSKYVRDEHYLSLFLTSFLNNIHITYKQRWQSNQTSFSLMPRWRKCFRFG